MHRSLCLAAIAIGFATSGTCFGQTFKVGGIGGGAMLPDGQTLVVAIPAEATLIYYDTAAGTELRRVELEFQPTAMATQGDALIVATKGSAVVHILDAANGKERSQVKLEGEPVRSLACHPTSGLVYAANVSDDILAIDAKTGKASPTEAKGQMLAFAANDPKHLYAGIQKPMKDILLVQRGPVGNARISLKKTNQSSMLVKYEVDAESLKAVAANDNASINGKAVAVTADGSRVGMAGGGGWMSKTDPHRHYVVPVFETSDMVSMVGQVDTGAYPVGVAFHPKEPWGAAFHEGNPGEVIVFGTKALTKKGVFKVPTGKPVEYVYLGFGAGGTKVIYANLIGVHNKDEGHIVFRALDASGKPMAEKAVEQSEKDDDAKPAAKPARKKATPRTARPKSP